MKVPVIGTGRPIAVWGLSFKPETDDLRESPAWRLRLVVASDAARARPSSVQHPSRDREP